MSVTLESLATCFQGILPAQLFTCSLDGVPNAAYLSHVEYVDDAHVALSFQFFNKSRRNVAENPHALVMVPDPDTGQGWLLRVRFVRSETEGPLFDQMALRIEAIASYCGLKGIFKLRAADVYEVLSIEPAPEEAGAPGKGIDQDAAALLGAVFTTRALQDLAGHINRADTLDALVDAILRGLDESLGFKHSAILVPAEEPGVLVTIATRGYADSGVGAEVRFGEGIGGVVAEARKPIRISGLMRGMLYAFAMHKDAADAAVGVSRRRIPMPGLANPESQLGIPLLVRGELVGVLCLESDIPYRFHAEDKASIELLGSYLAIAVQNMQLQERSVETAEPATNASIRRGARPPARRAAAGAAVSRTAVAPRHRLLRRRRVHPARRRISDPQPAGEDPVAAAHRAPDDGATGVHQPRAAPRQIAEPAGLEGQSRKPAAAPEATAATEVSRHPPGAARPRAFRPRARMRSESERQTLRLQ